ncbi:hypothetical protein KFL_006290020 [Klebsormidium nitens]|uniref:Stress response protein NST1 n=1 Tax=Klebsormidium nitens TaxID=105231 RepID=A0A1Y1INZ7_KLENI|nr:hypothetical protein KFL_006290020 [Klebsormidium nitens]|eukprot:GAQ90337.1 hypothetical protein KFL_006290020 [Klebsormidium nitens]
MSCYCYPGPNPPRYRNGDRSNGHNNGWHDDGRTKKKKKLGGIWDESETKEREKLKEFWLGLGDSQRQSLLRIEKESILREMREQQRHICSCSVCGRRRTVLEEELELLYDAYYSELEDRGDSGEIDIEMIDYQSDEVDLSLSLKAVEGGVLTVADDLLMDDGRKFFSLMEKLADGRAQNGYEPMPDQYGYGEQEGEYDDENYQEEDEELLEEQRIEEGRRMFQMFAAKMFEQRVLAAYREKVALEKQEQLMQEEEEEEKLQAERRENKARKERERKQKKKELKKQLDLEKERKRVEKEQEEQALREKEQREREEKRKEKQRQKEEEKKKKEEEGRRKSLELKEKERARAVKEAKEAAEKLRGAADEGKTQAAEKGESVVLLAKEAEPKQSKSSKKKAKKEKAAMESSVAEVPRAAVDDRETAEGWEVAHGKHKKKPSAAQEPVKEGVEPQAKKAADESLAALRSTSAARHYEQNGTHHPPSSTAPPGFQQPHKSSPVKGSPVTQASPSPLPVKTVPQAAPTQRVASFDPSTSIRVVVANPSYRSGEEPQRQNGGIPPGWAKPGHGNGANGPWNAQVARTKPELTSAHPQFVTPQANHTLAHPSMNPAAGPPFAQDVPGVRVRESLVIDVDQELSSSMEHLLPGGLLSATGDTPRGLNVSGFEDEFGRLQLLEGRLPVPGIVAARDPFGGPVGPPRQETEPPFHDANGHFRQASGSASPESLGSPDSTWSFGRRPGSGSNSSGKLSRPPSADVGRPWLYANGGEEHLRFDGDGFGRASRPQSGNRMLGPIGKAARQDIRVSWDGSQGMLGEPPLFEMVRSASHSALPAPAGSSPPGGFLGRPNQHPPAFQPRWEQPPPAVLKPSWPPGKAHGPFEARLEAAILVLRSAVARQDASGLLAQPLSLSAFWQSLLAIDGSLLNEGITRAHILAIWVELAKQQIVRVGHADATRPNEPFILAMLPPPLPERNGNKLGVCLLCNEALASVQLRPCLHLTCVGCTSQLAAQADFGELCCPFCAAVVQSSATLGPDGHFLPSEHPHPEGGRRDEHSHPLMRRAEPEHPSIRRTEPEHTPPRHKAHQMKESRPSPAPGSGADARRVSTPIDQEWPTLEAAVSAGASRKVEARPLSAGATKPVAKEGNGANSRPPSSNGSAGGEVLRKAGWGSVPKAGASPLPETNAAANGNSKALPHESSAWPPLHVATKGRGKGSGER